MTDGAAKAPLPWNAAKAARRSLVLSAIVCFGSINDFSGDPGADAVHERVIDWLTRLSLWDEVEPAEERILRAPFGALTAEEANRAVWRSEGLAVLAWALNWYDLPAHDQQIVPPAAAEAAHFLDDDAGEAIDAAKLRPLAELEAYRELMYAIHSRLRDFIRNSGRKDFTEWIAPEWLDHLKLDSARLIAGGDLAIDNTAISQTDEESVSLCETIASERHRAIIWLYDGRENYSLTQADT